ESQIAHFDSAVIERRHFLVHLAAIAAVDVGEDIDHCLGDAFGGKDDQILVVERRQAIAAPLDTVELGEIDELSGRHLVELTHHHMVGVGVGIERGTTEYRHLIKAGDLGRLDLTVFEIGARDLQALENTIVHFTIDSLLPGKYRQGQGQKHTQYSQNSHGLSFGWRLIRPSGAASQWLMAAILPYPRGWWRATRSFIRLWAIWVYIWV